MTDPAEDLAEREARVVMAVLERITQAPPPRRTVAPAIDILAWWRPALAAAAMIAIVAGWSLLQPPPGPDTVIEALGLPAPVTRWVEAGDPGPFLDQVSNRGNR